MKEQAIEEILNIFNMKSNDIAIRKWGKRKQITIYKLLDTILTYGNSGFRELNISKDIFSQNMQKLFGKKPKQSTQWYIYLLSLTNYKRCNKCISILKRKYFNKDMTTSDNLKNKCKNCDKIASILYKKENRDSILVSYKLYDNTHKEKRLAKNAKRRATKLKATPIWFEKEKIEELYKQSSKDTHIDHILPLQNNLICGLHCFDNLQAISAKENLEKSNKFEQDFQSMEYMEWLIYHGEAC